MADDNTVDVIFAADVEVADRVEWRGEPRRVMLRSKLPGGLRRLWFTPSHSIDVPWELPMRRCRP